MREHQLLKCWTEYAQSFVAGEHLQAVDACVICCELA